MTYGNGAQPGGGGFGSMPSTPGGGLFGGTMGGALPSTQASWPWMNNFLSGFGINSSMGANGLPQFGMPGAPQQMPAAPQMQMPPTPSSSTMPSSGFGLPFWMQMLARGMPQRPQLPPITSPQQPTSLPGQALQNRPPAVAPLPPAPAPAQTSAAPLVSDQMIQQYMALHPGVNYQMAAQLAPSGISPGLSFAQLNNNER